MKKQTVSILNYKFLVKITFKEKKKKKINLKNYLKESSKYTYAVCIKQKLKLEPI